MNNKLYNNIMKDVSKIIKKHLDEAQSKNYLNKALIDWNNSSDINQKGTIDITGDDLDQIPRPSDEALETIFYHAEEDGVLIKNREECIQLLLDELKGIFISGSKFKKFINDCRREWYKLLSTKDWSYIDKYGSEGLLPDAVRNIINRKYKELKRYCTSLYTLWDDPWIFGRHGIIQTLIYINEFNIKDKPLPW